MTALDDRPTARPPRPAHQPDLRLVVDALENVQRILSPSLTTPVEEITDFTSANRALQVAWNTIDKALNGDTEAADAAASASDLIDLTIRLRRADAAVRQLEGRNLANSLEIVRESLGRFDGAQSVEQLTLECPRAISQLGFDRGMLSMVDKSVWTPESAHSDRQPEWAHQLVASGQKFPQELNPSLPEFDLVRRSKSILVTNVQQNPKVYKEVVAASQSRSYVAAGVMSNGILMGFMHADRYFHRSDVEEFDRSILGLFAEAFGYILARAIVINRSAVIQSQLSALTAGIDDVAAGLGQFDMDFVRTPRCTDRGTIQSVPADLSLDNCALTRRETQVLMLMANGASNVEIATRLFIATGTVKSHVKHILRKLGAANRAEAVSRWYSSGGAGAGRGE